MSPEAVAILRASRRYRNGVREWVIPGAPNAVKLLPTGKSMWPDAASFSWPWRKPDGEWILRGVRLDWHRSIAKAAALEIIAGMTADNRTPDQVRADLYAKHGKAAP